ncbi:MAG: hypothetical protein QOF56_2872, partial [Acidobacteriaceae bacterium]|nr:hypothetical protein [Acidobacteriaceae bacterium]
MKKFLALLIVTGMLVSGTLSYADDSKISPE